MAYCPSCEKEVAAQAKECAHCGADFSNPDGWQPTRQPGTWRPTITGPGVVLQVVGRLIVGGICWFAFTLIAMLAGFSGGYSAGQSWLGLAMFLGFGVLCWALFPVVHLFSKE